MPSGIGNNDGGVAADACLFPGMAARGPKCKLRDWDQPVSVRGYRKRPARAASRSELQRRSQKRRRQVHPFDDFPLDRLGTHSFKRSAVTLMKDTCTSTALVGAIAGTTAKTLDRVYDTPTLKRQQALVERAYAPVADVLTCPPPPPAATRARSRQAGLPARFCSQCGKVREAPSWACCPWCHRRF